MSYTADSKGYDPYTSDDYFNTGNAYLDWIRKYTTKAVIFSNYNFKTEKIDRMNANYLGAYVINNMDLDISNYFKYVADMGTKLPAFNRSSLVIDGDVKLIADSEEGSNMLTTYNYVQYNALYDYAK